MRLVVIMTQMLVQCAATYNIPPPRDPSLTPPERGMNDYNKLKPRSILEYESYPEHLLILNKVWLVVILP